MRESVHNLGMVRPALNVRMIMRGNSQKRLASRAFLPAMVLLRKHRSLSSRDNLLSIGDTHEEMRSPKGLNWSFGKDKVGKPRYAGKEPTK